MSRPKLEIAGWIAGIISTAIAILAYINPGEAPPSTPESKSITTKDNSSSFNGAIIVQGSGNTISNQQQRISEQSALTSKLIGTWKGISTFEATQGKMILTGYTRLQETGEYGFSGEYRLQSTDSSGKTSEILITAIAAGTWRALENKYIITLMDIKMHPKLLKREGKPDITLNNPLTFPQNPLPRLEELTPKGTSQEFKIIEITPEKLRSVAQDVRGNKIYTESTREQ